MRLNPKDLMIGDLVVNQNDETLKIMGYRGDAIKVRDANGRRYLKPEEELYSIALSNAIISQMGFRPYLQSKDRYGRYECFDMKCVGNYTVQLDHTLDMSDVEQWCIHIWNGKKSVAHGICTEVHKLQMLMRFAGLNADAQMLWIDDVNHTYESEDEADE